ncbi:MAG: hypothetical protein ACW99U_03135 [Candidatus Thorarchaeota archaeon]|jgi:hypothetical protein
MGPIGNGTTSKIEDRVPLEVSVVGIVVLHLTLERLANGRWFLVSSKSDMQKGIS